MSKEKLIINKNNYEGYKKLLEVNSKMSNAEYRNNVSALKKSFFTFLISMIAVIVTPLFLGTSLMLKSIMVAELITFASVEGLIAVNYLVKVSKLKKEKKEMVKENYPYVDINTDLSELENKIKSYEFNKENGVNFEEYKLSPSNRVIEDGNVSFENINRDEYFDCFSECQNDNNYSNNLNQTEKSKVKKLTK